MTLKEMKRAEEGRKARTVERCTMHDRFLQFSATGDTDKCGGETRIYTLYPAYVYQEVKPAGVKSKYAHCRLNRTRFVVLSVVSAEVPEWE